MNRAALPWVLLGAFVLAWAASSTIGTDGSETLADLYARVADSIAVQRDSIALENARQAEAYTADSTRWEADRAEARAREAEAVDRARNATIRASTVATDLTARLDSTETAMFREYQSERDSIDAATDGVVEAVRDQLVSVTEDRDSLRLLLFGKDEEIAALTSENAALRASIESLHDRIRGLEREGGLVKLGAIALVGVAVYDKVAS